MGATAKLTEINIDKDQYREAIRPFNIRNYTNAPLRLQGEFHFNAPAEVLFNKMTAPQLIAGWFGMVKGGKFDHSNSCNNNEWGEGSKRYCETSMGTLDETIYFWHAPYNCL